MRREPHVRARAENFVFNRFFLKIDPVDNLKPKRCYDLPLLLLHKPVRQLPNLRIKHHKLIHIPHDHMVMVGVQPLHNVVEEPPALHSHGPLRPAAAGEKQWGGEDQGDGAGDQKWGAENGTEAGLDHKHGTVAQGEQEEHDRQIFADPNLGPAGEPLNRRGEDGEVSVHIPDRDSVSIIVSVDSLGKKSFAATFKSDAQLFNTTNGANSKALIWSTISVTSWRVPVSRSTTIFPDGSERRTSGPGISAMVADTLSVTSGRH